VGGQKDDGAGLARGHVAKHKHEKFAGFTSSINQQVKDAGFRGRLSGSTPKAKSPNKSSLGELDWPEIMDISSKVVRFVDVSGQRKVLKVDGKWIVCDCA